MYKGSAEQNCLFLLQFCTSLTKLCQFHSHILKLGLQTNTLILTKFTSISSGQDAIQYASSFVFSPESEPKRYDSFLFNVFIKAYADTIHCKHRAIWYYRKMLSHGVQPNKYTYPFLLKAYAGIEEVTPGKAVHGSVVKLGFNGDDHILNSLIHMYCKCKKVVHLGKKLFDEMPNRNSVSWSAMIGGFVRCGMPTEAIELFRRMQIAKMRPDEITAVALLSACADLGALELGRWVESCIDEKLIERSGDLCNAAINMFAKCGDLDQALRLFRNMSENKRSIVSWTSIITGMAMHGRGSEAVSFFEEMKGAGVVPDDVAFLGLLSACSHSGLVDQGKQYFDSMVNEYRITPRVQHYGCKVDLLSRAGLVEEAVELVRTMPVEPNPVIWRTLISACNDHGDLNLGEAIAKEIMVCEPVNESNCVLLSNIHAMMMDWEKKTKLRRVMGKKGVRKVPASAMILVGDGIHESQTRQT